MSTLDGSDRVAELRAAVQAHPGWFHTIDIAQGVTTPGRFDLRAVVESLPWANVRGKRCLDVGTGDGFIAFELERRGAAEVVGLEIDDRHAGDSLPKPTHSSTAGNPDGTGFRLVAQLLGSTATWKSVTIAELAAGGLGTFDVVVASGMARRTDPVGALQAVRRITRGVMLSCEPIDLLMTVIGRGRPMYTLEADGGQHWFQPNAFGHRRLLDVAGYDVERVSRPYTVRSDQPATPPTARNRLHALALRAVTGSSEPGVLHRALLARPRV